MYQFEISDPVRHWQPDADKKLVELVVSNQVNCVV